MKKYTAWVVSWNTIQEKSTLMMEENYEILVNLNILLTQYSPNRYKFFVYWFCKILVYFAFIVFIKSFRKAKIFVIFSYRIELLHLYGNNNSWHATFFWHHLMCLFNHLGKLKPYAKKTLQSIFKSLLQYRRSIKFKS